MSIDSTISFEKRDSPDKKRTVFADIGVSRLFRFPGSSIVRIKTSAHSSIGIGLGGKAARKPAAKLEGRDWTEGAVTVHSELMECVVSVDAEVIWWDTP